MTQNEEILAVLENTGSITALEALYEVGCFRLAARINDLRKEGYDIKSDWFTYTNSKGQEKRIKRYFMEN